MRKIKIVWIPRNILASIFMVLFGLPFVILAVIFGNLSGLCDYFANCIIVIAEKISGRR